MKDIKVEIAEFEKFIPDMVEMKTQEFTKTNNALIE